MSSTTLTRMDLSEAVFREVGLSRNESADLVESVLTHMSDALVAGESVKISSFGTFGLRDKTARVGPKPKNWQRSTNCTAQGFDISPVTSDERPRCQGQQRLIIVAKSPDAFRTISEVATWLGTQAHVLRFWESKFNAVTTGSTDWGEALLPPNRYDAFGRNKISPP